MGRTFQKILVLLWLLSRVMFNKLFVLLKTKYMYMLISYVQSAVFLSYTLIMKPGKCMGKCMTLIAV